MTLNFQLAIYMYVKWFSEAPQSKKIPVLNSQEIFATVRYAYIVQARILTIVIDYN